MIVCYSDHLGSEEKVKVFVVQSARCLTLGFRSGHGLRVVRQDAASSLPLGIQQRASAKDSLPLSLPPL